MLVEFDEIHPLGILSLLITNLVAKKLSDVQVMVCTSIFFKFQCRFFHLEINYMEIFKYEKMILAINIEHISLKFHIWGFSGIKKSVLTTNLLSDKSLRVYTSIFPKTSTSSFDLEILYLRVIKFQKVGLAIKMWGYFVGSLHVDLVKIGILSP